MRAIFYPDGDFGSTMIPWIYKEIFLDKCYTVLDNTRNLTILDIGANLGLVTDFMRPHAKKIYSVEPAPMAFECLKQNAEYNQWDNVELFNFAIGPEDGEATMSIPDENKTMGSIVVGEKSHVDRGVELYRVMGDKWVQPFGHMTRTTVQTKRIDTFLNENKIEHVDFMKLDVEGAEESIFTGDGFKNAVDRIACMFVEFHYPNWMDVVSHVIGLGYKAHLVKTDAYVCIFNR
jgi:FkbM family methyltransferase